LDLRIKYSAYFILLLKSLVYWIVNQIDAVANYCLNRLLPVWIVVSWLNGDC